LDVSPLLCGSVNLSWVRGVEILEGVKLTRERGVEGNLERVGRKREPEELEGRLEGCGVEGILYGNWLAGTRLGVEEGSASVGGFRGEDG
jgi:hypothetical protein